MRLLTQKLRKKAQLHTVMSIFLCARANMDLDVELNMLSQAEDADVAQRGMSSSWVRFTSKEKHPSSFTCHVPVHHNGLDLAKKKDTGHRERDVDGLVVAAELAEEEEEDNGRSFGFFFCN